MEQLLEFMKVMIPVYSVSVAFSTGAGTSAVIKMATARIFLKISVVSWTWDAVDFFTACQIEEKEIGLKVMIPVYSVSVAFSTGAGTSAVIYQTVLVLITIVDAILLRVVLPIIMCLYLVPFL